MYRSFLLVTLLCTVCARGTVETEEVSIPMGGAHTFTLTPTQGNKLVSYSVVNMGARGQCPYGEAPVVVSGVDGVYDAWVGYFGENAWRKGVRQSVSGKVSVKVTGASCDVKVVVVAEFEEELEGAKTTLGGDDSYTETYPISVYFVYADAGLMMLVVAARLLWNSHVDAEEEKAPPSPRSLNDIQSSTTVIPVGDSEANPRFPALLGGEQLAE